MRSKTDVVEIYGSLGLSIGLPGSFTGTAGTSPREGEPIPPLDNALAQIQELTAELNRLRAERERWQVQQLEMMKLLASKSPERLIHDLRNVLNERELYRSLADLGE